jgi:hypothetical protein
LSRKAVAEEGQVGEQEGGHRRGAQGQGCGQQADQKRVAEHPPEHLAGEDAPVVRQHPALRQAERIDPNIAQILEAAERRGEQRHHHQPGDEEQRAVLEHQHGVERAGGRTPRSGRRRARRTNRRRH